MGGGDAKKKDEKDSPSEEVLKLELISECNQVQPRIGLGYSLLAKVTASAQCNEDKRAPVTICAAIDRSGSMKDNLPLLKETIQFMITQLRAEDKLCLITFDHEVKIDLPVTNMDTAGKALAERAINNIKERGHTNLSGGLLAALQALYEIPADQATLVESVVLFSDGKANFGITDRNSLAKATRSLVSQIARQVCVFTLGYGTEHDPDTLHSIATAGGGLCYYIENKDNIPDSFCDCLGGLLSVAAQNVKLTFSLSNKSVKINPPLTTFPTKQLVGDTDTYQVTIPDIYHDEEKAILIEVVQLPVLDTDNTTRALNCKLEYFDVVQCKSMKQECSTVLGLSKEVAGGDDDFGEVRLQVLRFNIVKMLAKATELADKGNIIGAREVLEDCKKRILAIRKTTLLTQHLLETVEESLGGLESKDLYAKHGKPTMMQYLQAHSQQRSCSNPSKHGYNSQHGISDDGATAINYTSPVWESAYINKRKKAMKVAFTDVHRKK